MPSDDLTTTLLTPSAFAAKPRQRLQTAAVGHFIDRWTALHHLQQAEDAVDTQEAREALRVLINELSSVTLTKPLTSREVPRLKAALEEIRPAAARKPGSPEAALLDAVENSEGLQYAIQREMADFLVNNSGFKDASFSLVLFRSTDHGGRVLGSFNSGAWSTVLRPTEDGIPDTHLALIPPSDPPHVVERLAEKLGVLDKLPCVIFLGRDPDLEATAMRRLAAFRIREQDTNVPARLREIYRTVYKDNAIGAGTALSAAVDAQLMAHRWFWLGLAAGAAFGPEGYGAVVALEALIAGDASQLSAVAEGLKSAVSIVAGKRLQIHIGTVFLTQDGQTRGEMFVEPQPNGDYIEHWLFYDTFEHDKSYQAVFKPPQDWYLSYADFYTRTQTLRSSQPCTYMKSVCDYKSSFPAP